MSIKRFVLPDGAGPDGASHCAYTYNLGEAEVFSTSGMMAEEDLVRSSLRDSLRSAQGRCGMFSRTIIGQRSNRHSDQNGGDFHLLANGPANAMASCTVWPSGRNKPGAASVIQRDATSRQIQPDEQKTLD